MRKGTRCSRMAWSPAIMLMSSDEDQGYRDGLEGREPRPIWSTYDDGYRRGKAERERREPYDEPGGNPRGF
jgi:hypothetical protein